MDTEQNRHNALSATSLFFYLSIARPYSWRFNWNFRHFTMHLATARADNRRLIHARRTISAVPSLESTLFIARATRNCCCCYAAKRQIPNLDGSFALLASARGAFRVERARAHRLSFSLSFQPHFSYHFYIPHFNPSFKHKLTVFLFKIIVIKWKSPLFWSFFFDISFYRQWVR